MFKKLKLKLLRKLFIIHACSDKILIILSVVVNCCHNFKLDLEKKRLIFSLDDIITF